MSIVATYVDADTFTVSVSATNEFHVGRRVKANCGVDGIKYGTVLSSSYSVPNTTVNLTAASDDLTSNLIEVWYGIIGKGTTQSMPIHTHDGDEGSGGNLGSSITLAASAVSIQDTAGYYDATEAETAFEENGQELKTHNLGGWEDQESYTLSTAGTPPTLTVTFTGTAYWWSGGVRYSDSGTDDITITDTSGSYLVYYDGSTLSYHHNPSHTQVDDVIKNKCLVAWIYWNTNSDTAPVLGYENHGCIMSGETHHYLHDTQGAKWVGGGTVSGYILLVASDAAISFDVTDTFYYDEDIAHAIRDGSAAVQYEQVLTGDAEIPVAYHDSVDGTWVEQAASTLPYLIGGTPRIQWQDPDNSWARTEVTNNDFCCYYLIATNDWQYPIKMIPGTSEYSNINDARAGAADELIELGGMPGPEFIVMYQYIMQDDTGGTTNARIIEINDYRSQSFTGSSAGTATDHGSLTGLNDDDHGQYILTDGTRDMAMAPSSNWQITDTDADVLANFTSNSSVTLYNNNIAALQTRTNGVRVQGTGSGDLDIQAIGGDSVYITNDNEADTITIRGTGTGPTTNVMALFDPDGAVDLYYAGTKQFETTSTGVQFGQVDGTLRASNGELVLGCVDNGATTLYHSGIRTFETNVDGITVYDRSGDDPRVKLMTQAEADVGTFGHNSGADTYIDGNSLAGNTEIWRRGTVWVRSGTTTFMANSDNTLGSGQSSNRWTDVWAVDGSINTSDGRDKENIAPTPLGLDFINLLNPIKYKWKDTTVSWERQNKETGEMYFEDEPKTYVRTHFGMIAQEVHQVITDLGYDSSQFAGLIYDSPTDRYGLRYHEFISPMIKAIQELTARVEALESA